MFVTLFEIEVDDDILEARTIALGCRGTDTAHLTMLACLQSFINREHEFLFERVQPKEMPDSQHQAGPAVRCMLSAQLVGHAPQQSEAGAGHRSSAAHGRMRHTGVTDVPPRCTRRCMGSMASSRSGGAGLLQALGRHLLGPLHPLHRPLQGRRLSLQTVLEALRAGRQELGA